ncbi:MAG TPA: DUF935 family protein, partial [Niabella sp.]|nr:DUF935 family protein [Niabella sp.]
KTNTADKTMLDRAEKMMNDMGSAAWFIIDETETFEFAKLSGDVSGDVYGKLINLCNSENSMLISGAIIGQDTEHGNRSKDETAQDVLWNLVKSDMELVEQYWNETVMPALVKIGFLPEGLEFSFNPTEDIKQLFEFVKGLLPFKKIKNEWIKEKFGVEVEGDKESTGSLAEKLSHFFD